MSKPIKTGTDGFKTEFDIQESDVNFTDITTGNSSTSKHGYLGKLSGNSTDVLLGDGTFGQLAGSFSQGTAYMMKNNLFTL